MEVDMFRVYGKRLLGMVMPIFLIGLVSTGMASTDSRMDPAASNIQPLSMTDQVRHELVLLPYLGVFDDLGFTIDDSNTVVLTGQVIRPILKSDAEAAVRRVRGVSKVVNNIEVLPLSYFDDAIRLRTLRAIASKPGFEKYFIQSVSPIKIIVKNGHITLEGVVGNQLDKTLAMMAARSVPGAFSVVDNLKIG
jgi:hyperosmotically inducible protein